jgi:hypothetical protein
VPEHVDLRPHFSNCVRDRGHVLELALDRVGRSVARRAATAPVDGMDPEPTRESPRDTRMQNYIIQPISRARLSTAIHTAFNTGLPPASMPER